MHGAPSAIACSGFCTLPLAITMCVPAPSAIFAASILVFMPPFDSSVPASPAIASISGVMAVTTSRRSPVLLPPGGAV